MDYDISMENGDIIVYSDLEQELERLSKLRACSYTMMTPNGDFRFLYYRGQGFTISFNDYVFHTDTILKALSSVSHLELSISLGYPIIGTYEGIPQPSLQPRQFALRYTPHVKTRAGFLAGKKYSTVDFHFELPFLYELSKDYPILADFLDIVVKGDQPAELTPWKHFCNTDILAAIHFIQFNPYSRKSQERWIRAKAEEILVAAIEIAEEAIPAPVVKLLAHEKESLNKLKEYIETCPMELPLLSELSVTYPMNRDKLKKGFKKLFGFTIYEYYLTIKIEKAKWLLLATDKEIREIAYETGYHSNIAFSNAFRKIVGCHPLYFRKVGKSSDLHYKPD